MNKLKLVPVTALTLMAFNVSANPVTEFVDAQKNYILGMATGTKLLAHNLPISEENKTWLETEAYKSSNAADKESEAYKLALSNGAKLPLYVLEGGLIVLCKP